jgi:hypothetical protein
MVLKTYFAAKSFKRPVRSPHMLNMRPVFHVYWSPSQLHTAGTHQLVIVNILLQDKAYNLCFLLQAGMLLHINNTQKSHTF